MEEGYESPHDGMDQETAQAMREGTELQRLVESDGWAIAKGMLVKKLAILDSVSSLPITSGLSFEELGKQAAYRAHVVSVITEWLDEIEGRLEQDRQQKSTLHVEIEEQIVRRHG